MKKIWLYTSLAILFFILGVIVPILLVVCGIMVGFAYVEYKNEKKPKSRFPRVPQITTNR